jgi:hypothetical protein
LSGVLVAVLAIGVITLAYLAITQSRGGVIDGTPRPVPSFTLDPTTAPTPTPSAPPASTTVATIVAPGAAERFLSVGDGALWRGTAGVCGEVEPTLERSTNGGQTWIDVTPRYLGIGQLISVDAFAGSEAEIVALMGDDCELQALRTFTQGQFWEPNDDVLAAATYLDPANPATVITPDGDVAAPCPAPWALRADGDAMGLICDGTAYALVDDQWQPAGAGVLALATSDGAIVTAGAAADCTGLLVTTSAAACAPDVSPAGPAAIAASGGSILIWSADTWSSLPAGP